MTSPGPVPTTNPTESVRLGFIEIHSLPQGTGEWVNQVKTVAKEGVRIFGPYGLIAALVVGGTAVASALLFTASVVSSVAALPFGILALLVGLAAIAAAAIVTVSVLDRDLTWLHKAIQYTRGGAPQ